VKSKEIDPYSSTCSGVAPIHGVSCDLQRFREFVGVDGVNGLHSKHAVEFVN